VVSDPAAEFERDVPDEPGVVIRVRCASQGNSLQKGRDDLGHEVIKHCASQVWSRSTIVIFPEGEHDAQPVSRENVAGGPLAVNDARRSQGMALPRRILEQEGRDASGRDALIGGEPEAVSGCGDYPRKVQCPEFVL